MTERKFCCTETERKFHFENRKSFHAKNLEKIAKREIFAKEKREEILQRFE